MIQFIKNMLEIFKGYSLMSNGKSEEEVFKIISHN